MYLFSRFNAYNTRTHTCTHTHTHTYACTHTCTHTHTRAHMISEACTISEGCSDAWSSSAVIHCAFDVISGGHADQQCAASTAIQRRAARASGQPHFTGGPPAEQVSTVIMLTVKRIADTENNIFYTAWPSVRETSSKCSINARPGWYNCITRQ